MSNYTEMQEISREIQAALAKIDPEIRISALFLAIQHDMRAHLPINLREKFVNGMCETLQEMFAPLSDAEVKMLEQARLEGKTSVTIIPGGPPEIWVRPAKSESDK